MGKGNRPNTADPLSDEDIATFYSRGVLGIHSPRALLNTLWMNNCTFFGMSTKSDSYFAGAASGSLFQNCQIGTVNVQVYQPGRTEKCSKIRYEKRLKITVSDDSSSQSQ